jgi:hypothetical protein
MPEAAKVSREKLAKVHVPSQPTCGLLAHGFKASIGLAVTNQHHGGRDDFMKKLGAMFILLLVLGVPLTITNIQTLYSWFPSLKPAIVNAIDGLTGHVAPAGPSLRVTHECKYLDPTATQCWNHLRIVSLNDQPITIDQVIVNGRPECISTNGLVTLIAAQIINVTNKTIKTGDAYGVGISCEPVSLKIVTDKGAWNAGSK